MLWAVRAAWFSLAFTVSSVVADALRSWSAAPTAVVAVLLYGAWAIGLVALLVPRPLSFSVLRIIGPAAPAAVIATRWTVAGPSIGAVWILVLVQAVVACVLVLSAPIADACAQSQAYGTEVRRALRTPPLLCVVLALAWCLIALACTAGPLALANGHTTTGVVECVIALPVLVVLARSVHSLSRRFCVFVPAGIVVSDPLVLVDPVLLVREKVLLIGPAAPKPAPQSIDTRLGAYVGGLAIALVESGTFTLRSGRNATRSVDAAAVVFTPLRAAEVLALAASHRLRVDADR